MHLKKPSLQRLPQSETGQVVLLLKMILYPNSSLLQLQTQKPNSMVNNKFSCLLIFSLVILNAHSFLFKLATNDPTCFKFPGGHTYVLSYVVSGQSNQKVKVEVFNNGQFMMRKENVSDFEKALKFDVGNASVCFQRTDKRQKTVSFDFYKELDPVKEIIDKKDISITMKSLQEAIASLREVGKNQKFHIERNEINRSILQKSQTKIKWAGIIKIVFLITSALIQLWIMKSLFNKNSVPYQPVEQN